MKLVVKGPNGLEYEVGIDIEHENFYKHGNQVALAEEVMAAIRWMHYRIDLDKEMKERSEY